MVPILKMRRFSCLLRLSTLYSQFLSIRRLCIDDKDFGTKCLEMRTFFVERGCPTHLLDSAIQKAFNNSRRDTLKPPLAKISDDKISLVLTFHPFNYKLGTSLAVIFKFLKMTLRHQPFTPITLLSLLDAIKTFEII